MTAGRDTLSVPFVGSQVPICRMRPALLLPLPLLVLCTSAFAHDVSPTDAARISGEAGMQLGLYLELGAKHMVTGYDHLLFLVGVIFYLARIREIALLVSMFALGHSITLITGVLAGWNISPYLVDAVIGLSVVYKGFDNLKGFDRLFGERPNEMMAVFVFGLFHGLGLATKLQDLGLAQEGLLANLISFNIGVEIGQFTALLVIVLVLRRFSVLRERPRLAAAINVGLVAAGAALITYQVGGYLAAG